MRRIISLAACLITHTHTPQAIYNLAMGQFSHGRTVSPRDHYRSAPRAREPALRTPHPKNITRFVPPSLGGASSGHKYAIRNTQYAIFWWFGFTLLVTLAAARRGGSSGAQPTISPHNPSRVTTCARNLTAPCRSLACRDAGARPIITLHCPSRVSTRPGRRPRSRSQSGSGWRPACA